MKLRLDLQFFAGEKTEKATDKKRQDSRKKGQVLKSQDVTSALVILSVFLFLFLLRAFYEIVFLIFSSIHLHIIFQLSNLICTERWRFIENF